MHALKASESELNKIDVLLTLTQPQAYSRCLPRNREQLLEVQSLAHLDLAQLFTRLPWRPIRSSSRRRVRTKTCLSSKQSSSFSKRDSKDGATVWVLAEGPVSQTND